MFILIPLSVQNGEHCLHVCVVSYERNTMKLRPRKTLLKIQGYLEVFSHMLYGEGPPAAQIDSFDNIRMFIGEWPGLKTRQQLRPCDLCCLIDVLPSLPWPMVFNRCSAVTALADGKGR